MAVISIKNLNFSYNQEVVLEDINLEIQQNDFLAIIGPNGGGKSTLLKTILTLQTPQSGSITILGKQPKENLYKVGYVPQNTNINPDFPITVIEVVLMGHIEDKQPLFGYNKRELNCAMGALAQVGMEQFAKTKIGALSGGQRQRVMIARALCANPSILLLDEPTANIDVSGQQQIYELLKQLNQNITIVVVSHDISVILSYANKVAHINKTLTFHNMQHINKHHNDLDHFCEVEMLELLGKTKDCVC